MTPGTWAPPPVRRHDSSPTGAVATLSAPALPAERPAPPLSAPPLSAPPLSATPLSATPISTAPLKSKRRPVALMLAMLVVLGGVLGGGIYLVSGRGAANEAE